MTDRRTFLRRAVAATIGAASLPSAQMASVGAQTVSTGPYGDIDAAQPDANGILLPPGFASRVIARSGEPVPGTDYVWPVFPDGAAIFPDGGGGWYHAVNSEARSPGEGGVGAIHYTADGSVQNAYGILNGTLANCAGGATPWGTWLSCEEFNAGLVWECDPTQPGQGIVRPALGAFQHEAVAVDPGRQQLYLTEDTADGRLYRFTPNSYPDLSAGVLEAAIVAGDGSVTWAPVPDPTGTSHPTRVQVPGSTPFSGGEGIWFHRDIAYFTTKGDHSVWELNIASSQLRRIWQGNPGGGSQGVLTHVDNITVESGSGDLIVAEDGGNMELVLITAQGEVAPFMRIVDPGHRSSEVTGPVFSPDGSRLYFSSQRGPNSAGAGLGVTYEITGPFRGASAPAAAATAVPEPTAVPTAEPPTPTPQPATPEPATPVPPTPVPATPVPAAEAPATAVPPTAVPATNTPVPAAQVEPTARQTEPTIAPTPPPTPTPDPTPTETLEGALVINEPESSSGNGTAIALGVGGAAAVGAAAAALYVRTRRPLDPALADAEVPYGWEAAPVSPEEWPDVDGPIAPPPPDSTTDWPEIEPPSIGE